MLPRSGDVLVVGKEASVQFATPILFRVIRCLDVKTYDGWLWLEGYEVDGRGDAVERRQIFVMPAGLRMARPTQPPAVPRPRPSNAGPVGAPRTGNAGAQRAGVPHRNASSRV